MAGTTPLGVRPGVLELSQTGQLIVQRALT